MKRLLRRLGHQASTWTGAAVRVRSYEERQAVAVLRTPAGERGRAARQVWIDGEQTVDEHRTWGDRPDDSCV